jgi:Fe2+ or Zn2+ uptake regulation protein
MKHYYNTTKMEGEAVREASLSNEKQEARILDYMENMGSTWSAWDLGDVFQKIPITSIRRALFNLRESGLVSEVGMTTGRYGKPVARFMAKNNKQIPLF